MHMQKKEAPAKKLFVESTPVTALKPITTKDTAFATQPAATGPPQGECEPAEAVGAEIEVEIPTVEPDWSETLRNDGPGVMMQKLCGFRLSHAEKTPDDPAERCAEPSLPCVQCKLDASEECCFAAQDCNGCQVPD